MAAKFPILCSASLVALAALATPAWAQEGADTPEAEGEASTENQIIVTGIRASLGTAQALKEDAIAVTDSIVAEDIGKFPDNTVADALQRVTGIQVQRGAGEAGIVLIRGLPNVTSYINGREVFTGTGRGVALQDIPAELVAGVDVYKTATPDLIEGGVAGRIDIRLRRPFDLEPGMTIAGSARALYSDKREKWSYIASGLASGWWETEGGQEFGVLLGASYNKRRYRDQTAFNFGWNPFRNAATNNQFVLIPDTVGGLVTDGDRIRPAVNASVQWKPNPDVEFYADGIFTGYRNDFSVNFFVGLPKAGNVTAVQTQPGGNVTIPAGNVSAPAAQSITTRDNFTITSKQAFEQKTDGYQFASGLKVRSGNALFSTEVAYNDSTVASTSYILDVNYVVPRIDYNFNVDGTPNIQAFNATGGPFDLTDPTILDIFALFDQNNLATSKQIAGRADVELEIDGGVLTQLKGGVRLARRTGVSDGTGENRFQIGVSGDPYPELGVRGPTDIIEGRLGVDGFALPGTNFIRANIDLLRGLAGRPPGAPDFAPTLHFELVEKNYAFYGLAEFDFTGQGFPLEGLIGARVVRTDTGLDAILVTTTIENGMPPVTTVTPTSRQRQETSFLPNLTLKLRPADDFVLRLVAGRSITQPQFAQLNPATNVAPGGATSAGDVDGSGSGGSPDLRPIKTDNLDISAEWYFNRTGSLTLAAFYRKLDGYIQTYAVVETLPIGRYLISRPRNTGSGNLKGIEIAYQQFFDFLPGFLSGFGAQANFTLSDGEVEAPGQPGVMQQITPISKYSYNLVAMYEKYGFTARLAYNWRNGFLDFYAENIPGGFNQTESIAFLDFSASYDITPNVTVTVDATNLLDTTYRDNFGDNPLTPRDTRMYDRTVSFGARFRF